MRIPLYQLAHLILMLALSLTLPLEAAPKEMIMSATAYTLRGPTASGVRAQRGIVSADPQILPFGTVIRVMGAGRYSGTYVVADSGKGVRGREIDIYVQSPAEARDFGRRNVRIRILRRP